MSMDSFSEDEHIEPPSFSLATLGLQRVGTAPPPKPQNAFPKQTLNARGMPARIRKRNPFFFDVNIINDDKPLRQSLSPRKTPMKSTSANVALPPVSQYLQKSPNKLMKTPKGSIKIKKESSESKSAGKIQSTNKHMDRDIKKATLRFRSMLKLPKPHNWIINEFFASFIDQPLLESENDFQICLKHEVPKLNCRILMRGEWIFLRSMMGKPRRCSPRFFLEERAALENKRKKIRYLQSNRSVEQKDINIIRDLPDKIPLPLPLGTQVQARVYGAKQYGLQYGTVEAVNSQKNSYRITFNRPDMGKRTIFDCDIKSEDFFEMLPIQSISKELRPYNPLAGFSSTETRQPFRMDMRGLRSALSMNLNKSDPLLGQEVYDSPYKNPVLQRDNINGRPVVLLEHIVRLRHALITKRNKLQRLSDMNIEAERRAMTKTTENTEHAISKYANGSSDESVPNSEPGMICGDLSEDFQRRYATIIISMERVNRDIQDYLYEVQKYGAECARDPQEQASLMPTYLREKCREIAEQYVCNELNSEVGDQRTIDLVKKLCTILVVASQLRSNDSDSQVPKVLEGVVEEVKSSLVTENASTFQRNVQIHLHHIRLGIGQNALTNGRNNNFLQNL